VTQAGYSWHQPEAEVPNHPKVQEFFRGPLEVFTYGFPDIKAIGHAKNWVAKHQDDHGTSATYTTGGPPGRGAFIHIQKRPRREPELQVTSPHGTAMGNISHA
jgi:hypothetical protein